MHYKQNNITVCVAVGTDTHCSLCRRVGCTLINLIYGVVSYCAYRVKGGGVVHDSACWAPKVPREWGRDRGCCGGRAKGMIRARSRPQAAGAGGGSPPPLRPRHLAQNGRKHEHKFNFTLPPPISLGNYYCTYLPCRSHRRPCRRPLRAGWSWRRWGCSHRSSPRSSPPPGS